MNGANIISGVHHIRQAYEFFEDIKRENPGTKGAVLFAGYNQRLNWIVRDLITHNALPAVVREGIKNEWECDVFAVDAIAEKVALLNPEQRDHLEAVIDLLLKGEKVTVVYDPENIDNPQI